MVFYKLYLMKCIWQKVYLPLLTTIVVLVYFCHNYPRGEGSVLIWFIFWQSSLIIRKQKLSDYWKLAIENQFFRDSPFYFDEDWTENIFLVSFKLLLSLVILNSSIVSMSECCPGHIMSCSDSEYPVVTRWPLVQVCHWHTHTALVTIAL